MKIIDSALTWILKIIMIISTAIVFLVCFIQVFSRFCFQISIPWSSDVMRICFIYAVFSGAAWCAKTDEHISLDVILSVLPNKARQLTELIIKLIIVFFCIFLTVFSIRYTVNGIAQRAPYLPINMSLFFAALPLSTGIMTYYYFMHFISGLKRLLQAEGAEKK